MKRRNARSHRAAASGRRACCGSPRTLEILRRRRAGGRFSSSCLPASGEPRARRRAGLGTGNPGTSEPRRERGGRGDLRRRPSCSGSTRSRTGRRRPASGSARPYRRSFPGSTLNFTALPRGVSTRTFSVPRFPPRPQRVGAGVPVFTLHPRPRIRHGLPVRPDTSRKRAALLRIDPGPQGTRLRLELGAPAINPLDQRGHTVRSGPSESGVRPAVRRNSARSWSSPSQSVRSWSDVSKSFMLRRPDRFEYPAW